MDASNQGVAGTTSSCNFHSPVNKQLEHTYIYIYIYLRSIFAIVVAFSFPLARQFFSCFVPSNSFSKFRWIRDYFLKLKYRVIGRDKGNILTSFFSLISNVNSELFL